MNPVGMLSVFGNKVNLSSVKSEYKSREVEILAQNTCLMKVLCTKVLAVVAV